jgi:hypothetical protein
MLKYWRTVLQYIQSAVALTHLEVNIQRGDDADNADDDLDHNEPNNNPLELLPCRANISLI